MYDFVKSQYDAGVPWEEATDFENAIRCYSPTAWNSYIASTIGDKGSP